MQVDCRKTSLSIHTPQSTTPIRTGQTFGGKPPSTESQPPGLSRSSTPQSRACGQSCFELKNNPVTLSNPNYVLDGPAEPSEESPQALESQPPGLSRSSTPQSRACGQSCFELKNNPVTLSNPNYVLDKTQQSTLRRRETGGRPKDRVAESLLRGCVCV